MSEIEELNKIIEEMLNFNHNSAVAGTDADMVRILKSDILARFAKLERENNKLKKCDEVWRNKYAMIQNDLAKSWTENKELKEDVKNLDKSLEIQADRVDALIKENVDLEEQVDDLKCCQNRLSPHQAMPRK